MSHFQIKTQDAARSTAMWGSETFEPQSRFSDVAMALLPASLILAAATALLVAML